MWHTSVQKTFSEGGSLLQGDNVTSDLAEQPFCFVSVTLAQILIEELCHSGWKGFTAEYVMWQIHPKHNI